MVTDAAAGFVGAGFADVGCTLFSGVTVSVGGLAWGTSCDNAPRAAMPERMALAAGAFVSVGAGAVLVDSSGVKVTSKVSPVRMGLVKSAFFPLTRMVKVTRLVAGGGVKPTASRASLTFALPVPF